MVMVVPITIKCRKTKRNNNNIENHPQKKKYNYYLFKNIQTTIKLMAFLILPFC